MSGKAVLTRKETACGRGARAEGCSWRESRWKSRRRVCTSSLSCSCVRVLLPSSLFLLLSTNAPECASLVTSGAREQCELNPTIGFTFARNCYTYWNLNERFDLRCGRPIFGVNGATGVFQLDMQKGKVDVGNDHNVEAVFFDGEDRDANSMDDGDGKDDLDEGGGTARVARTDCDREPLAYLTENEDAFISTLMGDFSLAPASQIAYFYLHKNLGLSEEVMWKITVEHGSILGLTVKNLKKKVGHLRRSMGLDDEDIRTILTKQPQILMLSAEKNLSPTINLILRELRLEKSHLKRIVLAYPAVLCYSMTNLYRKLDFFKTTLALPAATCKDLLVGTPRLLTSGVNSCLVPNLTFLTREILLSQDDVRNIALRQPRLFIYSTERLRETIISFFIMVLRMEVHNVRRILMCYPQIIDYGVEKQMLPVARYFLGEAGFSPLELRRVVIRFPRILSYSLEKIRQVDRYFGSHLGLHETQVKRVMFQCPQVVGLSEENLSSKVEFLRDTFNLTRDELKKVVGGMPTLVTLSAEKNLGPKMEFLLDSFDGNANELRSAFVVQPTLMAYSLDKRIRPRMESMKEQGLDPRKITVGITFKEKDFAPWLLKEMVSSKTKKSETTTKRQRRKRNLKPTDAPYEDESTALQRVDRTGRIVKWVRSPGEIPPF